MQRNSTALALIALGTLTACLNLGHRLEGEREYRVKDAVEAYANSLRWGRIETALRWVDPEVREGFVSFAQQEPTTVQFTDYAVQTVELAEDPNRADAWVRFEMIRLPALQERSVVEHQIWKYHHETKTWFFRPDVGLYQGPRR